MFHFLLLPPYESTEGKYPRKPAEQHGPAQLKRSNKSPTGPEMPRHIFLVGSVCRSASPLLYDFRMYEKPHSGFKETE